MQVYPSKGAPLLGLEMSEEVSFPRSRFRKCIAKDGKLPIRNRLRPRFPRTPCLPRPELSFRINKQDGASPTLVIWGADSTLRSDESPFVLIVTSSPSDLLIFGYVKMGA